MEYKTHKSFDEKYNLNLFLQPESLARRRQHIPRGNNRKMHSLLKNLSFGQIFKIQFEF